MGFGVGLYEILLNKAAKGFFPHQYLFVVQIACRLHGPTDHYYNTTSLLLYFVSLSLSPPGWEGGGGGGGGGGVMGRPEVGHFSSARSGQKAFVC